MTYYDNPINGHDHAILSAVQRATVRCAFLEREKANAEPARQARIAALELAELAITGHEAALKDAAAGIYDTGNKTIPVLEHPYGGARITWGGDILPC